MTVKITTFGTTIAGENYTLDCSVNGNSASIQWLDESGTPVTNRGTRTITTSSSRSQLLFTPLYQSHGRTYTCNATIGGVRESQSVVLFVNGKTVHYQIQMIFT